MAGEPYIQSLVAKGVELQSRAALKTDQDSRGKRGTFKGLGVEDELALMELRGWNTLPGIVLLPPTCTL